ncbi:3025_t:CDS:2, partial [Funneliformis caledonium]
IQEVRKEDWKWPCYEEWYNLQTGKHVRERKNVKNKPEGIPYKVVYKYITMDYCKTIVELSSKPLIDILRVILPKNSYIFNDVPKVEARDLYHIMNILPNIASLLKLPKFEFETESETEKEADQASDTMTKIHLNHLIRFLEQEFEQTNKSRDRMLARKMVSFDMLWSICVVRSASQWYNFFDKEYFDRMSNLIFEIKIDVINCDRFGFKRCHESRMIGNFKGEISFSDLPVIPLRFSESHGFLEETITRNGEEFFRLASKNHFMSYEDPLLRWKMVDKCLQVEKLKADGRVMIDLQSFETMNLNFDMGNAESPNECDYELLCKKGMDLFEVLKFSNIRFDSNAFNELMMDQHKKNMLEGLVKYYSKGCIILCYGLLGTGKTLTAESVAESLNRPLWIISVHELGMEPAHLEKQLIKVLDIAFIWKTVLLLDEADIYLERRTKSELQRNAMVGIFLRKLEYYQGILFLTTNRAISLDDAICSRISMFFHYDKLSLKERHQVWANFIIRVNLNLKADDFVEY